MKNRNINSFVKRRRGHTGDSPVISVSPFVSGIPLVNETLSTTDGTWLGFPTLFEYQWQRNGVNIEGATNSTYVLVTADLGKSITAVVTAINTFGSTPATSNIIIISTLQDGLINWWDCDEGPANLVNSVSGAPNLVYTQGASAALKQPFKRGYGTRRQSVNTYETAAVQASPNGTGSFTVAGWFSIDVTASIQVLWAQWGASNRRWRVYYDKAAGQFKVTMSVNGSATATTLSVTYSEALLLVETTLVIFEHDAENDFIRLKIGNQVSLGAFTSTAHSTGMFNGTGQKIGIGSDGGGNTSTIYFGLTGIWNRKLISDEHTELWNYGRGIKHPFIPSLDITLSAQKFAFFILPDTQHSVDTVGRRAKEMGWWIADAMREHGVTGESAMIVHEGDIRHKILKTDPNVPAVWTSSLRMFAPFMAKGGMALPQYGNHDMDDIGQTGPGRLLTEYHAVYPQSYITNQAGWDGGFFDSTLDNYYYLFTAGGQDWILISTEAVPRDVVMDWVDDLLTTHSDRKCIYVSHQIFSQTIGQSGGATVFMDSNDNSMTAALFNPMGDRNGGTDQWNYLKGHDNVVLLVSGHDNTDAGNGHLILTGDLGNKVVGLLRNYQEEDNVTDFQKGWVVVCTIDDTEKTVDVKSYQVAQQTYDWEAANLTITPEDQNVEISYE